MEISPLLGLGYIRIWTTLPGHSMPASTYNLCRNSIPAQARAIVDGAKRFGAPPPPFPQEPSLGALYDYNARLLRGVRRKDGEDYITHPVRLVLLLRAILGDSCPATAPCLAYALAHDTLEEGGGVTADSIEALHQVTGGRADITLSAVALTEPVLNYPELASRLLPRLLERGIRRIPDGSELSTDRLTQVLKAVAFTTLLRPFLADGSRTEYANSLLADKTVNVCDLDYLNRFYGESRIKGKVTQKLGLALLFAELARPFASAEMTTALVECIHGASEELGVSESEYSAAHETYLTISSATSDEVAEALRTWIGTLPRYISEPLRV
jgi:hypothetical protein